MASKERQLSSSNEDIGNFEKSSNEVMPLNLAASPSSFMSQIESVLKKNGLTLKRFQELKLKSITELTNSEVQVMKAIRDSVPPITIDTPLQKTFPIKDIDKYLSGEYKTIGGYISKVDDVSHIRNYDDVVKSLRLDYVTKDGSRPFPDDEDIYGMIRFKTESVDKLSIPYGERLGGSTKDAPPCTLNGFTGAKNGEIIPEWKLQKFVPPSEGAELFIVKHGKSELLGVFDGEKFVPIKK